MTDTDELIKAFNDKHNCRIDGQFRQLVEEIGELAEAVATENREQVLEECADVEYVARSIALLAHEPGGYHRPPQVALEETAEYNLKKSGDRDGSKVTDDVEEL